MEQTRFKGASRSEDLVCVAQETGIASRFTADPLSLVQQLPRLENRITDLIYTALRRIR